MKAAQTQLIPIAEMTPGMVASIRNSVISRVVGMAVKEFGVTEDRLVVRDIQPYTDLGWQFSDATKGTSEGWKHEMTLTSLGYLTVTGDRTMNDQRFVAIFGIRDGRIGLGATDAVGTATDIKASPFQPVAQIGLVKFTVGGAVKAIWDIHGLEAYVWQQVGFTPAAVIIPQNSAYNISFYLRAVGQNNAGKGVEIYTYLQLVGVTVEPRGVVISP